MKMRWRPISLMTVLAVMMALGGLIIPTSPAYADDQMYENHLGNTGMQYPTGGTWYAQTFTAMGDHQATSVQLYLSKYGSPGTVTVSIRAGDYPTGPDLATGTTDGNTLPQFGYGGGWRQVTLSPALSLSKNAKYAIVVRAPSSPATDSICWLASYGGGGDQYSGGTMYESTNSGASWDESYHWDGSFQVWGPSLPPPNQPPVVWFGYVTPTSGSTSTTFSYYVNYYDGEGDSPTVMDIYIDGVAHSMSLNAGSAANGVYVYGPVNVDCSTGVTYHRYSFSFNDGQGNTTCLPASCSGFTLGPDITLTLGEVLDNKELSWSTGGDAPWTGVCDVDSWNHNAAQSGFINHSQSTWLKTMVKGPGTLSFYWKVNSEHYFDCLEFYIDDVLQDKISGYVPWELRSYHLSSGTHSLRWQYVKDPIYSEGLDESWVDKVVMESDAIFFPIRGKDGKTTVILIE